MERCPICGSSNYVSPCSATYPHWHCAECDARWEGKAPQAYAIDPLGQVVIALLKEVSPDLVMWRTTNNDTYTAGYLIKSLEAGNDTGRQFASDLLRVTRDFIQRQAARGIKIETTKG